MKRFQSCFLILLVVILSLSLTACDDEDDRNDEPKAAKPVIYLYPTEKTDVTVSLDYKGELFVTYPRYGEGWNVTAYPDGTIINKADNGEYSYLFWEGNSDFEYDFSTGFVVEGKDTESFLREKLKFMGLIPKEYNEFIVYWLPKMINNSYNLISFQQEAYTDNAVLEITPAPDSILRVFMAFKPLMEAVEIEEQKLEPFHREGFAVIEWGGSELAPDTNPSHSNLAIQYGGLE